MCSGVKAGCQNRSRGQWQRNQEASLSHQKNKAYDGGGGFFDPPCQAPPRCQHCHHFDVSLLDSSLHCSHINMCP